MSDRYLIHREERRSKMVINSSGTVDVKIWTNWWFGLRQEKFVKLPPLFKRKFGYIFEKCDLLASKNLNPVQAKAISLYFGEIGKKPLGPEILEKSFCRVKELEAIWDEVTAIAVSENFSFGGELIDVAGEGVTLCLNYEEVRKEIVCHNKKKCLQVSAEMSEERPRAVEAPYSDRGRIETITPEHKPTIYEPGSDRDKGVKGALLLQAAEKDLFPFFDGVSISDDRGIFREAPKGIGRKLFEETGAGFLRLKSPLQEAKATVPAEGLLLLERVGRFRSQMLLIGKNNFVPFEAEIALVRVGFLQGIVKPEDEPAFFDTLMAAFVKERAELRGYLNYALNPLASKYLETTFALDLNKNVKKQYGKLLEDVCKHVKDHSIEDAEIPAILVIAVSLKQLGKISLEDIVAYVSGNLRAENPRGIVIKRYLEDIKDYFTKEQGLYFTLKIVVKTLAKLVPKAKLAPKK